MKIGFPKSLDHPRHRYLRQALYPDVSYKALPELSLYGLQGLVPFCQNLDLEFFRGVYCFRSDIVDLIHSYNRIILNHKPWIVDVEHPQRLFHHLGVLNEFKSAILSSFFRRQNCRRILPWSHYCLKLMQNVFLSEQIQKKMCVVYPGVPFPDRSTNHSIRQTRFLFVGRHFLRKGGHWAIEAFLRLTRKNKKVHLTIVSPTAPPEYLEKIRTHPQIDIIEKASPQRLADSIYPSHQVLVIPTRYETFGIAILEAMSYGLVIICTDIGALPEVVTPDVGITIPLPKRYHQAQAASFNDLASSVPKLCKSKRLETKPIRMLFKAMEAIASNASKARMYGKKGRKRVKEHFSIQIQAQAIKPIYRQAIYGKQSR